jgi:hypothetical protein
MSLVTLLPSVGSIVQLSVASFAPNLCSCISVVGPKGLGFGLPFGIAHVTASLLFGRTFRIDIASITSSLFGLGHSL